MEMALEGPEDVAHGGSGDVALGGPGEKKSEEWLLGIAQGGLPEAALVEPGEQKPNETQNTKWVKELTCWPRCSLPSTRKTQWGGGTPFRANLCGARSHERFCLGEEGDRGGRKNSTKADLSP